MKTRNDNHLQMANQESNIDRGEDKMNLLKIFNSKRLKKSCSLFLSSIVTLSILSVANSSLAFPVRVKNQANIRLFNRPLEHPGQKYRPISRGHSQLEIELCTVNGWCYTKGYSILSLNKFIPLKGWVLMDNLCDDATINIPFLPTCSWSGQGSNIQFVRETEPVTNPKQQLEKYYCTQFYRDLLSSNNMKLMKSVGFLPPNDQQLLNLYPQCLTR